MRKWKETKREGSMVAMKKEGWTWWQSEQERKNMAETENENSGVYFRRRNKERGREERLVD